jgi:hypothetical protein
MKKIIHNSEYSENETISVDCLIHLQRTDVNNKEI